ncbi:MAG: phytanoyl-CoA dioxygenase family protein [Betaproteobacteria bacterium]|jgi:ectoine hydroxylase-related dioxygenase (phytanoyl-CoA dioxygenase family)|nr:phytanoyl-CoA dioxygenase family protein [Rhodocyclaceae bacterium]MCA3136118.1 phytanoyl-CoA dioxygenase family protein [Rhodocyclaceae bacterium]MCA3143414.1 phytanoyl-CoA dioxygenase family protein [Rhodocyclaceae bacterium]MCA3147008.1 phytanoyl-CoA dioxygenase family protein [Rhodocyclaceae bacterium]MCE2898576.1 phytanoyl-CoA dioxygenase family protein [Betaproteobacteria bacterium]
MITGEQVAFYRDEGYVVVEGLIGQELLGRMRRVVDRTVEGARGLTGHNDVYDLEPSHRPDAPRVRRIKKPHQVDAVFAEVLRTPGLLMVLRALLGPHVRLHGSKLNIKAPRYGSPVEWHQDWAFYPHTNDDILAIGVMLDDVGPENGPMLVLPGTHRGPTYDHHAEGRFCGAMDPAACGLDFSKAVPCLGRAGSCSFHHVRLVHGSAENSSDRPRQLLLYECAAADAWPLVNFTTLEEFDSRMICGSPTLEPRLEKVPVRMPLPPALNQGSIYENQTAARSRWFQVSAAAR